MNTNLKRQIELLEEYSINNYEIIKDRIIINGSLYLDSLTEVHKDFLRDTEINGHLDLGFLTEVPEGFLEGITINGYLDLSSLTKHPKDFLKRTKIDGYLHLHSLTEVHKDFLEGTKINGALYLSSLIEAPEGFLKNTEIKSHLDLCSLTKAHKNFLKNTILNGFLDISSLSEIPNGFLKNAKIKGSLCVDSLAKEPSYDIKKDVTELRKGYNKEHGYCYFDNILSKVERVKKVGNYTVYKTPFEYVVEKDGYTAHAVTIREGMKDIAYKIFTEKVKHSPINEDTLINKEYYRVVTGACKNGMEQWIKVNEIEDESIKAKDLIPLLEKTNAYGLDRIKKLITF